MSTLTSRMQAVQSPLIPFIGELIHSNPGTISLGQGVVYYGPPPEAIALLPEFLADPENHKYKPVQGKLIKSVAMPSAVREATIAEFTTSAMRRMNTLPTTK